MRLRGFFMPMNPIKIYLDTSVPSAPFDLSKPLRNHITSQWFAYNAAHFELYISSLTIQELNEWSNLEKRTNAFLLLEAANVKILDVTDTMQALAEKYITLGAIPSTEKDDALHLACATLSEIPNFVSWDFRHIVSVNPILKIKEIHQKLSLPLLQIGTLSLFGADVYGVFEPEKFKREKGKLE
jgi:predicted nucleic acid-binding protein